MKKRITLVIAALLAVIIASAQVTVYNPTKKTADYQEVTGGTVINLQGCTGH